MQRQKLRSNPNKKFGQRNGRSSCAHSIGKFFLCYMVLFSFETSATGSPGNYLYILIYLHIFMFFISNEVTSLILCPFSGTHGFHHAMHLRRFFEPKNQVPTSAELLRLQRRVRRGWEMLWGQTTWIDWLILAFGNVRVLGDFWKVLVFWWCVFSRICFKKLLP